jgi:hypothetical protein
VIVDRNTGSNMLVYRKFLLFLTGTFLIGALIMVYVLLNIAGSNDRMALGKLEEIKRDLQKEQKELKINIDFLDSPEQLEALAQNKYGMSPVTGDRIYIVKVKRQADTTLKKQ